MTNQNAKAIEVLERAIKDIKNGTELEDNYSWIIFNINSQIAELKEEWE